MNLFILKTKFCTCLTFSRIFENSRMIFRCSVFLLWIIPHMMRLLLQTFVRMAISYERRVDCVRVVASWEKFDEVLARRRARSQDSSCAMKSAWSSRRDTMEEGLILRTLDSRAAASAWCNLCPVFAIHTKGRETG